MGDQGEVWNGPVGAAWVRHADRFDEVLRPFGEAAMSALSLRSGAGVLDVGCGTAMTTTELGRRVHPGRVVGLDLSETMLALARERIAEHGLTNVELLAADAQETELPPTSFDAVFSRFGVMFFDRPEAAFANLAGATRLGGELAFVCFQGPERNPFIAVPLLTAAAHLDLGPPIPPGAPGPFSLADPDRIRSVLEQAGWTDVTVQEGPDEAVMGAAAHVEDLAARVLEQNPLTCRALGSASDGTRAAAVAAVAEALAGHEAEGSIRMGAGTWVVHARRM